MRHADAPRWPAAEVRARERGVWEGGKINRERASERERETGRKIWRDRERDSKTEKASTGYNSGSRSSLWVIA